MKKWLSVFNVPSCARIIETSSPTVIPVLINSSDDAKRNK